MLFPFLLVLISSSCAYASYDFKAELEKELKKELKSFQTKIKMLKQKNFKNEIDSFSIPTLGSSKKGEKERKDPYYFFFKERELWKGK